MNQFDVFETGLSETPYAVNIQSSFLEPLATRVVIPLRPAQSAVGRNPLSRLTPTIDIFGQPYVLDTPQLAAVLAADLKQPIVSLGTQRQTIMDAVDFLLHGY